MSFSFQLKAKKKNPFQKQKELEEQRKKRDDEEAAKVYEEFVKDFGDADDEPKFVSGGVIQPGQEPSKNEKLATPAAAAPPSDKPAFGGRRHFVPSAFGDDEETKDPAEESVFKPPSSSKGKARRIDMLLENMKRDQAERELRREQGLDTVPNAAEPSRAVNDAHDQASTNLFVGNLAPDVDESMLLREFGRFGPIGSVKVMWPRDDEQRRRGRNTGFVAFMRREDAEKAREALDGVILRDLQLTIGWGKSVPLPQVPLWPPPGGVAAGELDSSAFLAGSSAPESSRQRMHDGPPPKEQVRGRGPDIEVKIPEDPRLRFIINAMAYYVLRDGCEFEQVVMEREANNPEFNFLFDVTSTAHVYYRWRLFSLASGDSLRSWRVDPFLMVERSNRWIPPPMTLAAVAQKHASSRADRKEDAPLSEISKEKLAQLLRTLTVERQTICDAMVFILNHAESASDVAEMLVDALTLSETPVPLKIARLFLLSDVLHNTSAAVRNVSRYRGKLQEALPDVFESLQEAYRNADGRMAQELLRKHVLKVLRVWRGWYIFSDDYLNGLQATFLRGGTGPAGTRTAASEIGGNVDPALAAQLATMTDAELEVKCKHSGLSRKGGREAQVARLLALDGYLNGGNSNNRQQQQGAAATSGGGGGEAKDEAGNASGWETVSLGRSKLVAGGNNEEEHRKRSREMEIAEKELRERLEEQGVPKEDVERQVQEQLDQRQDGSETGQDDSALSKKPKNV